MFRMRELFLVPVKSFTRGYHKLFENGSSYSAVTAVFAALFIISLGLQLTDSNRTALMPATLIILISLCVLLMYLAIRLGKALPPSVGLIMVAAHGIMTAYILGTAPVLVKATAALQEMPLMAMYLAWFYPKKVARLGVLLYMVGVLGFASIGSGRYLSAAGSTYEVIRLVLFMGICMELGFLWRGRVRAEGQVDLLTGAVSREGFAPRALKEMERAVRHKYSFSLAVIDLDGFKQVNDSQGHDAGDQVLISVVRAIKGSIRGTDEIFRIGGDEFVLILPHTNESDAVTTLARLSSQSPHQWSYGVAEMVDRDTPEAMVLRADTNMYKYKRGR